MKDASKDEILAISKEVFALTEEKKTCINERVSLNSELERIKNWGEIEPQIIADLSGKGVEVSFYEMPKAEYDTLGEVVKTVAMEKGKNTVKFLLIKTGAEGEAEFIESLKSYRFELPKISTQELTSKIEESSLIGDLSIKEISLSIVLGIPTMLMASFRFLITCAISCAQRKVPSPPIQKTRLIFILTSVSTMASSSCLPREDPRIEPPASCKSSTLSSVSIIGSW